MVLAALWPARSPRLTAPSNNPSGVTLLPSCRSTLATHYRIPGGTCSLFGVPPLTMLYLLLWCSGPFALPLVGGNQKEENLTVGKEKWLIGTGKLSLILTENLTDGRPSESGSRAPIKMIDGRPWSPNLYRNLRLIGESRASMGEGVCLYLPHLIINLRLLSYTRAPTAIPRAAGWNNALHQH